MSPIEDVLETVEQVRQEIDSGAGSGLLTRAEEHMTALVDEVLQLREELAQVHAFRAEAEEEADFAWALVSDAEAA